MSQRYLHPASYAWSYTLPLTMATKSLSKNFNLKTKFVCPWDPQSKNDLKRTHVVFQKLLIQIKTFFICFLKLHLRPNTSFCVVQVDP